MSESFFSRTALLLGADKIARLQAAHVAVVGLGGVGSAAAEAIARSGVGQMTLVDGDRVVESNLNRQLFALRSTIGLPKTEAAARRIAEIHPECQLHTLPVFLNQDSDFSFLNGCQYCLDAIDDVRAKLLLYQHCRDLQIPIISAMGCGNRLDPTKLVITDVFDVTGCPLCRKIRHELRRIGIDRLTVVASTEPPIAPVQPQEPTCQRTIASAAFVPNAAGLAMASHVIRQLCS